MNIFRLAGDMTHLLSIIVLLLKIQATKSCAGACLFCVMSPSSRPVEASSEAARPADRAPRRACRSPGPAPRRRTRTGQPARG